MRIGRSLLKLPIRFCGETLAREVNALPPEAWMAHPQRYDGNSSVPLVSPDGALIHRTYGPMAPTEWLRRCPYVLEIMQALDSTWGRSRLMGLEAGADVPDHVDIHYYWRTHLRIHIPVITNPDVGFTCDGETIHMGAGDCYILDSFYRHSVANRGSEMRVHLVLDTVGSGRLWDLIEAARQGSTERTFIKPGDTPVRSLDFEQVNAPLVMSPWEMRTHIAYITEWTDEQPGLEQILTILDRFVMAWSGTWARHAVSDPGLPFYVQHLNDVRTRLSSFDGPEVRMKNGRPLLASIDQFILANAIAPAVIQKLQMGVGSNFRMSA
jgi:Aspartyl/Asparaginyl beta-hydroxylase